MPSCSVPSCKNNNTNCKGKNVKFHRFPTKNPEILSEWEKVCGDKELNLKNGIMNLYYKIDFFFIFKILMLFIIQIARVCSDHFKKNCYVFKPEHLIIPDDEDMYILCKTAIPTENLSICNISR